MRRHLFLTVLALTVAIAPAAPAAAAGEAPLPGLAAYRTGDFEGAVRQLREAIPNLRSGKRMQALTYLSASLFALGKTDDAELNLRQLFHEFPEAKLDPSIFEPDLIALAERVRAEETTQKLQKPFATPPPTDVPVVTKSRGPAPYIATGGALLTLGAGVWFITSSSNQRNQLDRSFDSSSRSTLTYPQAQALSRGANRDMALFAVSTATSAVLTGVATWLWTRSEE
jgi:tetratricopeptide (TPR) repeat protein